VRKLTAALTALLIALGLTLVAAGPAGATVTAPANGATIRDVVTLSSSGGYDDSTANHCSLFGGSSGTTRIQLINSGGTVVFEQFWDGEGSRSASVDTRGFPRGAYTVRDTITIRKNSGFLGAGCKTDTVVDNNSVTIDNFVSVSYSGALSAPRNTSIPVSATVVDGVDGSKVAGVSVTFSLGGGGGSATATTNANGVASTTLPVQGSPRDNATLTVSAATNPTWRGATITRSFDVTRNATTTTIPSAGPSVHGQPVHFTAVVARSNGTGTPTGTVQFTLDGNAYGAPVDLDASGVAITPWDASLTTGTHTIGASYSGDSGFDRSDAAEVSHVVEKAGTRTNLFQNQGSTVSGQPVTFIATVEVNAPGDGALTNGVQFTVDGAPFGPAVPLSGHQATLTVSNLSTGNHTILATYNGTADLEPSSSAELTHGVDKADAALDLSSSEPTAVSGQALTFTADVSAVGPGSGTPTGDVQFSVDGEPLGDPVPLSGGTATSPTAHLGAGTHEVTAGYSGDTNFGGANGTLNQEVGQGATTTAVSSSPNPSVFGQPVALSATVSPVGPATGTPTGHVQFYVDGVPSGLPVALVEGQTEPYAVTNLSRASHTITAVYLGDTEFTASDSDPVTQVVNKAQTKVTVESSAPTSVFGQPVTLTATVSAIAPGAGNPSGSITFKDGATVLGTVPVDSSTGEQASLTTSALTVGQHAIVATYSGDDSFMSSTGTATQTVHRAQTSVVVTSSANPAQTGQGVKFTAAISPVAPGAGIPTGTVVFTVNGATLGSPVAVVDGSATSSAFASLSPGTYTIKATYSGDGNFLGSSGLLDQGTGQTVSKGATSLALASSPELAASGAPVTFTATVSAVAPATGRPSGVVRFWEGPELLGASSLVPGAPNTSQATFVSSTLGVGTHSIRAEYVGNFNFDGSTASTSQTVSGVDTVTGIESSADPSTFGDDLTLTAVVAPVAGSGEPTGTVTFTEGSTVLGTATLATVGGRQQASLTLSGLAAGAHDVVAAYSGSAQFVASTSAAFVQDVGRAQATLVAGEPDRRGKVTATLTGVDGQPLAGETIAFSTNPSAGAGRQVCVVQTDADGVASCDETVINIVIGGSFDGAYVAAFAGNDDYLPVEDDARQF
jgi:hypothetical protein